ncbi:CBS domain-containing protein [Pseudorhizobium flavum]|uniref:CBS domain-containing protein n=1 Tax=Pseudorhizobium flavum TaxID=1335061 RepID=A0A7W9Z018_9HYPH|nr:CBS domain-containing protein [Pseudorhizobium flavum]MBB6181568.1 CBS domain-containing protein [Pseudorhizobium flavum]CAD6619908.1 CBS domain-containing protein [Pseudorhizobium flavum]
MLVDRLLADASSRLIAIPEDAPVTEAALLLGNNRSDMVVVCDSQGVLAGVVTKSDVVAQISHCCGSSCTMGVAAVMTKAVADCSPGDRLNEVWQAMKDKKLKNVPVVDAQRRPLGVLAAPDVLQALMGEVEQEEALLRDYVMCIGYH